MNLEIVGDAEAFKVRAAAVIVRDGRVLLNALRGPEATWFLPGGTVEFGETIESALARELREELGAAVRVGRLLWVVEHFFPLNGRRWHQHLWLHEATLPEDSDAARRTAWQADGPQSRDLFQWTPLADVAGLRLLPGFLAEALARLPAEPGRLVHVDG